MAVNWSHKIDQRRLELLDQNLTYKEIAFILTEEFNNLVTERAVENRCRRSKTNKLALRKIKNKNLVNSGIINKKNGLLFPEKYYNANSELSLTTEKIEEINRIYNILTSSKPKKVLSLSDLHAPSVNFHAVEKALLDNKDADILLLNGDVYDGTGLSTFDKLNDINIEDELEQIFTIMDVATKMFKYIVWVGGNHDWLRFLSFVTKNFNSSMKKYVLKRLNPIDYIAEKYDNLIVVPHDWAQIGDVIFAHLQTFSSVDMKTVVTNNEIFSSMRHLLPNQLYRGIVIGHTHHLGKIIKNGVLLMEQGCMCHLQDYRFQKPAKNRWETGYAVVYFDDNMKVDFNKSNFVII